MFSLPGTSFLSFFVSDECEELKWGTVYPIPSNPLNQGVFTLL